MKYILNILIFITTLFNCAQLNKDFIINFHNVSKVQLKNNLLNPIDIKYAKKVNNSNIYLLNYFLISSNDLEYKYNYIPNSKNSYYLYYKYKLNEKIYLISYIEEWGYLTEKSQYICTYNIEKDKVLSVLKIFNPYGYKVIGNAEFLENNVIQLKTTYENNLENGLDIPIEQQKPKIIIEKYKINDDYIFEKVK